MGIISELKRRNVFRVAAAYLVIGWLLLQVASVFESALDLPAWFDSVVASFLIIGFPLVMFFSWAYEITPEGIKKEIDIERDTSITAHTAKKLDIITLAAVVGVIGLFVYQQVNPPTSKNDGLSDSVTTIESESSASTSVNQSDSAATTPVAEFNSIAVLAFANMSSDKEQEYFADGISEEILNALVKSRGLSVAGRTSSFSFKGKDTTIKEIGEALNVAHVLEGSVRKQGNRVRITAQLVKTDNEFHVWSETYDGSLDDIFDLQENISRQVTDKLKVLLNLDAGERLASKMTEDVKAYDLFLRGREKVAKRLYNNIPEGIALLEQAVERDPDFAEAWAVLAEAELVAFGYIDVDKIESEQRALDHAQNAISLNNKLALPHAVLGLYKSDYGDHLQALDELKLALRLEPDNILVNRWIGSVYSRLNRIDLAAPLLEKTYRLDPLSSINTFNLATSYYLQGEVEAALSMFRITDTLRKHLSIEVSYIHEYQGNYQQAIDHFTQLYKTDAKLTPELELLSDQDMNILGKAMFGGTAQEKKAAQALSGAYLKNSDDQYFWQLQLLIFSGNIDRAYEVLEEKPGFFDNFSADFMWYPNDATKKFRADPRFIKLLQRHKLPEAWQAIGWPQICKLNPGTDGSDGQFRCS